MIGPVWIGRTGGSALPDLRMTQIAGVRAMLPEVASARSTSSAPSRTPDQQIGFVVAAKRTVAMKHAVSSPDEMSKLQRSKPPKSLLCHRNQLTQRRAVGAFRHIVSSQNHFADGTAHRHSRARQAEDVGQCRFMQPLEHSRMAGLSVRCRRCCTRILGILRHRTSILSRSSPNLTLNLLASSSIASIGADSFYDAGSRTSADRRGPSPTMFSISTESLSASGVSPFALPSLTTLFSFARIGEPPSAFASAS